MSWAGPEHPDPIRLVHREAIRPAKSPAYFHGNNLQCIRVQDLNDVYMFRSSNLQAVIIL